MKTYHLDIKNVLRVFLLIISIIFVFEIISELESFSETGKKGFAMGMVQGLTRPANIFTSRSPIKPHSLRDLDFPPEPDSLMEDKSFYADSTIYMDGKHK